MILIRRYLFLLVLAGACGSVVVLGARGYLLLREADRLTPQEAKIQAENLLYLAIILAVVLLVFVLSLALRSRNITRELDKIAEIARYGSTSFDESLRRLGPIGTRIQSLNHRLADLNEKKSLRMSSMAAINTFLVNNARLPVVITDITGKVTAVSPRAAERVGQERPELVGRFIKELIPEVDFQAVASRLEKEHMEHVDDVDRNPTTYYPVLNRNNELSNVICVFGKEEVVSAVARGEERGLGAARGSRVASFVRRALRARK